MVREFEVGDTVTGPNGEKWRVIAEADPKWNPMSQQYVEPEALTLADFILARIREDEQRAKDARGWHTGSRYEGQPLHWKLHMERWSPERTLIECEAKRRMVKYALSWKGELSGRTDPPPPQHIYGDAVLRALAQIYQDHPDFNAREWLI